MIYQKCEECYKEENKDLIFWYFPTILPMSVDENSLKGEEILKQVHELILDPQIQYVGVSVANKEDLNQDGTKQPRMKTRIKRKPGNIRHQKYKSLENVKNASPYNQPTQNKNEKNSKSQPPKKILKKKEKKGIAIVDLNDHHITQMPKRSPEKIQSENPSTTSGTPKFNQDSLGDSDFEFPKRLIPKSRFNSIASSPIKGRLIQNSVNQSNTSLQSTTYTLPSNRSSTRQSKEDIKLNINIPSIKLPFERMINSNERRIKTSSPQKTRAIKPPVKNMEKLNNNPQIQSHPFYTHRERGDLSVIPESERITDVSVKSALQDCFFITNAEDIIKSKAHEIKPTKSQINNNAFTFSLIDESNLPKRPPNKENQCHNPTQNKLLVQEKQAPLSNSQVPKVFHRRTYSKPVSRNNSPDKKEISHQNHQITRTTDQSSEDSSMTSRIKKHVQSRGDFLDEVSLELEKFRKLNLQILRGKTHDHRLPPELSSRITTSLSIDKRTVDSRTVDSKTVDSRTIDSSRSSIINPRESLDMMGIYKRPVIHIRSKSTQHLRKQANIQPKERSSVQEFEQHLEDQRMSIPTTRVSIKGPSGDKPDIPSFHFRRFSLSGMNSWR